MNKELFDNSINLRKIDDSTKKMLIDKVDLLLKFFEFDVDINKISIKDLSDTGFFRTSDIMGITFPLMFESNQIGVIELSQAKNYSYILEINRNFIIEHHSGHLDGISKKHLSRITQEISLDFKNIERIIYYSLTEFNEHTYKDGTIHCMVSHIFNSSARKEKSLAFVINESHEVSAIYEIENNPDNEYLLGKFCHIKIILSLYRKTYPQHFQTLFPNFNIKTALEHEEDLENKLMLISVLAI